MPPESTPHTKATEVSEVVASSASAEDLPAALERKERAAEHSEVEQECSVGSTCTTDKSNEEDPEPEIRRSERERKPAERLCYSKLGEPCAKSVVVRRDSVHLTRSHIKHFPEHYNSHA